MYFARDPVISQNTCSDSIASGSVCNVELDKDTNQIIRTISPGLFNGASIGVYVPGEDTGSATTQYDKHGAEAKPFGTYDESGDMTTFYSFVNDRNGYKGGLMGANDPDKRIFWVKIFSLEVAIRNSPDIPRDEAFQFLVTLSGDTSVADQKSAKDIHGYYGQMFFYSDGVNSTTAMVNLSLTDSGENWNTGVNCIGENLSQDLDYVVIPQLTTEQAKKYALIPQSHTGIVGEFNKAGVNVDESERYISRAVFKVVPAVCKLTDISGNLLYYYYEDEYRRPLNPNKDECRTGVIHYLPAVYPDLQSAVSALEKAAIYAEDPSDPKNALYQSNATPYAVTQGVQIQMLIDYKQQASVALPAAVPVTLTTASNRAATTSDPYIYRGAGNRATIRRAYEGNSMFAVSGNLTLTNIALNGREEGTKFYNATSNGGFASVEDGGTLKIETNALLQYSYCIADGGAIYVADGGTLEMSAGTIRYNEVSGNGGGIYLESGAVMKLSGNPNFGGNDLKGGSGEDKDDILGTYGNFKTGTLTNMKNGGKDYRKARQDIFIAEKNADAPASLIINGDLTGTDGSIWVWAEQKEHYRKNMPFARLELPEGVSLGGNDGTTDGAKQLKIFRNAQDDATTENDTDTYLYGTIRGDKPGYVCWSGVEGFAHVMLVKVLKSGTSYQALSNRSFTVYKNYENGQFSNVATGTAFDDSGEESNVTLSNLPSGAGGAFFIGELAYGKYYVKESGVDGQHFEFAVNENGVINIADYDKKTENPDPQKEVKLVG